MKQRLVGTIVLGSLALILIPLLLDGEGIDRPPLTATIPPAPVIDTTPLPDPERPVILADSLTTDSPAPADTPLATPVATTSEDPAPATPTTTDAETSTSTGTTVAVPAEVADTEPATPAAAELVTQTEPAPEPAAAAPAAQSINEPALGPDGLPEAWTVRLGVFGDRANADGLLKRLLDAGHKAYIRPAGALSGVYVGPVLTRSEAVALQGELKTKFQISDIIVQRYDIAQ